MNKPLSEFEKFRKSLNKRYLNFRSEIKDAERLIEERLIEKFSHDVDSFYRKLENIKNYEQTVKMLRSDLQKLQISMYDIYKECARLKKELSIKDRIIMDKAIREFNNHPLDMR